MISGAMLLVAGFFYLLANSFSYSDADLGWHLRIGQDILSAAKAPVINQYNYTLAELTWVDHEWLLNGLMAGIFNKTGFLGLHLFFVLVALVAFLLAWWRSLFLGGWALLTGSLAAILCGFGIFASRFHLGIRVQAVGLFGVALILYILPFLSKKRYWLWLLPLFFAVWANLHGSFLLGLGLLGAYFFYALLAPWWQKWHWTNYFAKSNFSRVDKFNLGFIFVFSLVATLINPYGLGLSSILGGYTNTFYMSWINEWQSQFVLPLVYSQLFYLVLPVIGLLIFYYQGGFKKRTLSLWDFICLVVLFILAFKSRRHFPIFVVMSVPVLTFIFQEEVASLWRKLSSRVYWVKWLLLVIFFVIMSSFIFMKIMTMPWRQDSINAFCDKHYPCQAVAYLQNRPETLSWHLWNEYNWGGFLLWRYPTKQLFIDGRMPQAAYRGRTILEEYVDFRKKDTDLSFLLDQYQIRLVLISNQRPPLQIKEWEKLVLGVSEQGGWSPDYLREYLDTSPDWQVVFKDKLSTIYEKN